MGFWSLVGLLAAMLALRAAFVARHLRDLDRLWSDYERRGLLFRLAWLLDVATLLLFLAGAAWTLREIGPREPPRLGAVFVAWFGTTLLSRLSVHRFPRTNVPGAWQEAQGSLIAHVAVSLLGAAVATCATGIWIVWQGS
jgi:hypothetical protein